MSFPITETGDAKLVRLCERDVRELGLQIVIQQFNNGGFRLLIENPDEFGTLFEVMHPRHNTAERTYEQFTNALNQWKVENL